MGRIGIDVTAEVPSTVLHTLVDPQINISSVGDTYTDAAGNTYAETTNQTRMTTNAAFKRYVAFKVSGHVDGNTGTIQLYDFTQSGELNNKTTTATTETTIAASSTSQQVTTLADVITLRVKNSNAGGTFTIDAGGMVEGDDLLEVTSTGYKTCTGNVALLPGWLNSWKYICLKGLSTAAITIQPVTALIFNSYVYLNIGSSSSTLNSIITATLSQKLSSGDKNRAVQMNVTAITSQILLCQAFGISADDV